MAGLDSTPQSSHFTPQPSKPSPFRYPFQENSNPNHKNPIFTKSLRSKPVFFDGFEDFSNPSYKNPIFTKSVDFKPDFLDGSEELSNPNYKNRIFTKSVGSKPVFLDGYEELSNPNHKNRIFTESVGSKPDLLDGFEEISNPDYKDRIFTEFVDCKPVFLDGFEELCPPKGDNKVVIYTTSLRGVRKTFEACNAVRAVLEGFGVFFCERDISMDNGFREELRELMKGKDKSELVPPRVFVRGRYVGGSDEVLRIVEERCLGQLLDGLPKSKPGCV